MDLQCGQVVCTLLDHWNKSARRSLGKARQARSYGAPGREAAAGQVPRLMGRAAVRLDDPFHLSHKVANRYNYTEVRMSLRTFLGKQFIAVIQWNEDEEGVLAYRYPMQDMEIQKGGQLTVRESQVAPFVNEGRIADVFAPGLYTLNTRNLPVLTDLMNWDKGFESPFKSDVYFFSTRLRMDQNWGTATPITIRDKEFGAVRLRGYGIYSYRIADPKLFYTNVSGTREIYYVADLEGQLRDTIVAKMTDTFATSDVAFLDMAANQATLAQKIAEHASPAFKALGLELNQLMVENLSLPDELQKVLDQRIGMNMVGDLGRYAQFEAAQAIPIAAANEGGAAGVGVGLGAGIGMTMAQTMMNAMKPVRRNSGRPGARARRSSAWSADTPSRGRPSSVRSAASLSRLRRLRGIARKSKTLRRLPIPGPAAVPGCCGSGHDTLYDIWAGSRSWADIDSGLAPARMRSRKSSAICSGWGVWGSCTPSRPRAANRTGGAAFAKAKM